MNPRKELEKNKQELQDALNEQKELNRKLKGIDDEPAHKNPSVISSPKYFSDQAFRKRKKRMRSQKQSRKANR